MPESTQAQVLPTHAPQLFRTAVLQAAELLKKGEVVALPTETVYGLAANAFNPKAVSRIFEIKGRPAHNPIIVHIASLELAKCCVIEWPVMAEKLGRAFWPGPLTLVLPRAKAIPDIVTGDGPTVGVRWPSHPFIQAVIQECDFPLAAPSANPAKRLSPTTAEHVRKYFGERIPLIIDGGPSHVGIESTVLDLSVMPPRLLRPGMINQQALLAVTGELVLGFGESEEILKSPGQLPQHYSPRAKLLICSWKNNQDLHHQILKQKVTGVTGQALLPKTHIISHTVIPSSDRFPHVCIIPHDAEAFARAIYAALHESDDAGAELIVVEDPPDSTEWHAIRDRLKRAAADE